VQVDEVPHADCADLTGWSVRTLVLYSLAEFQSGHATTIRVVAESNSFSIADDGRGHAIERTVAGEPYLQFVYTHLHYPFKGGQSAPVQLHGLGMSLVNALCSELTVTVCKPNATHRLVFRNGCSYESERSEVQSSMTGNTVSGTISPHFCASGVEAQGLRDWLQGVKAASPSLKLFFNGYELQAV
jgi:DNA gyrase/topoisomerase IV subunit B